MEYALIWIASAILTAAVATSKGRSTFGWLILGCFFSLLALIAVGLMPSIKPDPLAPSPDTHVRCPDCRELVLMEALKCKHCGAALQPTPPAPSSAELLGRRLGNLFAFTAQQLSATGGRARIILFASSIAAILAITAYRAMPDKAVAESEPVRELKVEPVTQIAAAGAETAAYSAPTPSSNWNYSIDIDKMSGKQVRHASIEGEDDLNFGFPYRNPNKPTLYVRSHPKYGIDVILQIEKGQFICRYDNCSVMVRFDDKPAVRFSATEPADNSSTAVFLTPAKKMIAGLKASKIAHVQATFYQEGDKIMTFKTAGLNWK